jgi:uncharacterized membrane protein
MGVREKFSPADNLQITNAIRAAEHATSGEIRVHIEERCSIDPLDRAAYLFQKLDMHKTQQRNGVLFYLAFTDRKFAIIGDAGINQKVPEGFWNDVYKLVTEYFKKGDFAGGLSEGIILAGNQLKAHFPLKENDVNELTDEISFGEEK